MRFRASKEDGNAMNALVHPSVYYNFPGFGFLGVFHKHKRICVGGIMVSFPSPCSQLQGLSIAKKKEKIS
jgi:hypothetical protein